MDNTLFQKQLYELMKKYPKEEDFISMMNSSLRGAAQQILDEQSMKDYADAIIELIKNGRSGEEATLQSFLAYWLALNEHGSWKDYYNDSRIIDAIAILKKQMPSDIIKTQIEEKQLRPNFGGTKTRSQELTQEQRNKILGAINTIDKIQKQLDEARKADKTFDDKLKEQGI